MKFSILTGFPAHEGGCYHCENGKKDCFCPGVKPSETIVSAVQDTQTTIIVSVIDELTKARAKFPPFNSAHEGWAIIKEELDELWEVVRENQATPGRDRRMAAEARQVAAMALRFIIDMPNFRN